MQELAGMVLRVSIMYLFVLALLRLSGKRSVGDLSSLDFIVTLIIGDMFDDVFWAEIPLSQAVVGVATIILLHTIIAYITYLNKPLDHLINGRAVPVIRSGRLVEAGMRRERFPEEEVHADLRIQGEDRLEEIREACLEPSGRVSVMKKDDAKPAQKKDLPRLLERFR